MPIDIFKAISQSNEIASHESSLRKLRSSLLEYKNAINSSWKATEVSYIHSAVDSLLNQINQTQVLLEELKNDMIKAANTIKLEEHTS